MKARPIECEYCRTLTTKTYRLDEDAGIVLVCRACWLDAVYCQSGGRIPQNPEDA